MASSSSVMLLLLVCGLLGFQGVVASNYVVGGKAGWTTPDRSNVNYTAWALSISFKVGDTLEFNYAPKSHNVLEVTRSNFRYCNVTEPLVTHADASGKTVIELSKQGNYYFVDGIGTHCNSGQKFLAKVSPSSSSSVIASSPSAIGSFEPSIAPSAYEVAAEPSASPAIPPAVASATSSIPSISLIFIAAITMLLKHC